MLVGFHTSFKKRKKEYSLPLFYSIVLLRLNLYKLFYVVYKNQEPFPHVCMAVSLLGPECSLIIKVFINTDFSHLGQSSTGQDIERPYLEAQITINIMADGQKNPAIQHLTLPLFTLDANLIPQIHFIFKESGSKHKYRTRYCISKYRNDLIFGLGIQHPYIQTLLICLFGQQISTDSYLHCISVNSALFHSLDLFTNKAGKLVPQSGEVQRKFISLCDT